ncbi:MAG: FAD-dependent thymidylate synthase [Clostridia bacterium]|nr:FAD-dependent thymidylate synthase [Clostridia bacterium]MDD4386748.1 FAD-dependent thymidylate synthase [Clostridia bacterium]
MSNENMKVKIFNATPDLEKVCSAAARMSTTEGTCTDVYEGIQDLEDARKTLSRIIRLGHVSVLEHGYFNIMFENVSLFFEQFLIEHRISAYTIKSGRYVDFRKAGCYEPEFRYTNEVSEKIKQEVKQEYIEFVSKSFEVYKKFVDGGIKVEDARFILPYSLKTNIYCSMNARELLHLIWAILYGRGKEYLELVEIGIMLKDQLNEIAPSIAENLEKIETGTEIKEEKFNELFGEPVFKSKEDTDKKPLIEIISITSNPEETIAISAIIKNKQCSTKEAKQILDNDSTLLEKILDIVFEDKRKRELEQVNITFRMNDMPLILLKHQVRHRLQNINVPSFTEIANTTRFSYPPSIVEKGEEYVEMLKDSYDMSNKLYEKFANLGIYKEDLVYLYAHGKNIDVVTTMNARILYHICNLRTCNRAQWKMREYYREILNQLIEKHPSIFKKFGPNCYTKGYCPEGKLSCGKMQFVKEDFAWTALSIENRIKKEKNV